MGCLGGCKFKGILPLYSFSIGSKFVPLLFCVKIDGSEMVISNFASNLIKFTSIVASLREQFSGNVMACIGRNCG